MRDEAGLKNCRKLNCARKNPLFQMLRYSVANLFDETANLGS